MYVLNDFESCTATDTAGDAGTAVFASPFHESGYRPLDDFVSLFLSMHWVQNEGRAEWSRREQSDMDFAHEKLRVVRSFLDSDVLLICDTAKNCVEMLKSRIKISNKMDIRG